MLSGSRVVVPVAFRQGKVRRCKQTYLGQLGTSCDYVACGGKEASGRTGEQGTYHGHIHNAFLRFAHGSRRFKRQRYHLVPAQRRASVVFRLFRGQPQIELALTAVMLPAIHVLERARPLRAVLVRWLGEEHGVAGLGDVDKHVARCLHACGGGEDEQRQGGGQGGVGRHVARRVRVEEEEAVVVVEAVVVAVAAVAAVVGGCVDAWMRRSAALGLRDGRHAGRSDGPRVRSGCG